MTRSIAALLLLLPACSLRFGCRAYSEPQPRPALDWGSPPPKQMDASSLPSPRSCPPGTTCAWLPKPEPSPRTGVTLYPKSACAGRKLEGCLEALDGELRDAAERMKK